MKMLFFRALLLLFCSSLVAPKLERSVTVKILTDVELAKGLSQYVALDTEEVFLKNVENILQNHNVSKEDFYETIEYYSKNITEFISLYDNVEESLSGLQDA